MIESRLVLRQDYKNRQQMKPNAEDDAVRMKEFCPGQYEGPKGEDQLYDYDDQNGVNGDETGLGGALKVRAKGPGLLAAHVNQYAVFQLDATKAGCGDVDVVIKGPSKATITFVEEAEALYRVHYIVTLPGDYFIEIRFNGNYIPGSPFPLYIGFDRSGTDSLTGSIHSLENAESFGSTDYNSNYSPAVSPRLVGKVKREKKISSLLQSTVQSPSGIMLKGKLIRKVDKTYAVTFPHPEVGTYLVNIINVSTGKAIRGSPFKVNINELTEEEEMRVTGKALERCRLGEAGVIKFQGHGTLNPADLMVAFEGNGLVSLRAVQSESSSVDFLFTPKKAGILKMHAQYKGTYLKGSPWEIRVTNRSVLMSKYEVLPTASAQLKVIFWLGFPSKDPVQTNVISPSGEKVEHTLSPFDEGSSEVTFTTKEVGEYRLEVSTKRQLRPIVFPLINKQSVANENEPFEVDVDYESRGEIGKPCLLALTSASGPVHQLSVEFSGPGKIDIDQTVEKDKIQISYQGTVPGIYRFHVLRDGAPVAGSPWLFTLNDENSTTE